MQTISRTQKLQRLKRARVPEELELYARLQDFEDSDIELEGTEAPATRAAFTKDAKVLDPFWKYTKAMPEGSRKKGFLCLFCGKHLQQITRQK